MACEVHTSNLLCKWLKWHNTFKRENPVNPVTPVFVSFAEFTQIKAVKITTVESSVNQNWPVPPEDSPVLVHTSSRPKPGD